MHWTELKWRATPIAIEKGFNDWPKNPTIQELIRLEACLEVFHGEPRFAVGDWVELKDSYIGSKVGKLVTEIRWDGGYRYVTERFGMVREWAEEELVPFGAWAKDVYGARKKAEARVWLG